jgi:hypothetical protein
MALRTSKSLLVAVGSMYTLRKIFGATAVLAVSLAVPNHLSAQANDSPSGSSTATATQGGLNMLPDADSIASGERRILTWPKSWGLAGHPSWKPDSDNHLKAHPHLNVETSWAWADRFIQSDNRNTGFGLDFTPVYIMPRCPSEPWDPARAKLLDRRAARFAFHFHTGKFQWALSPALSRSRRGRRPSW